MSARVRMAGIGVAFTVMVALTTVATAQPQGGRGGLGGPGMFRGGGMGEMGGLMYLRSEQVQKELNLTEEQKDKLRALGEKLGEQMRERFSGMRDLSEQQRRERFQEMQKDAAKRAEETRKELAGILKPEQFKRLRQIELQQQGAAALMRPEVAENLGLTAEQKEKLEQIGRSSMEKIGSLFQEGRDRERSEEERNQLREKGQQIRQEGEKEAMAVLTPEQKQKLRDMMGEPFELDRSAMFGRGGDRGGDRGDRGGDRGDRRERGGDRERGRDRDRRAEQ